MSGRALPPEQRRKALEKVAETLGVDVGQIPQDFGEDFLSFCKGMGADSLDIIELVMEVEEEPDFPEC